MTNQQKEHMTTNRSRFTDEGESVGGISQEEYPQTTAVIEMRIKTAQREHSKKIAGDLAQDISQFEAGLRELLELDDSVELVYGIRGGDAYFSIDDDYRLVGRIGYSLFWLERRLWGKSIRTTWLDETWLIGAAVDRFERGSFWKKVWWFIVGYWWYW